MKTKKRLFLFVLFLTFSLVSVYANYQIIKHDIKIDVQEDYVLKVKEDYVFDFEEPRHGFYRVIPYQNYINHNIKISNIKVEGGDKSTERSGGFLTIRVGDPDITVIGENSYSISYTFDIGADRYEDYDELYYNIIGTMWDCEIRNTTFEINFPKPIDTSKVWLTYGQSNSTDVDNSVLSFSDDKKVITGKIDYLDVNEGATIRVEMEDGYFVGARDNQKNVNYFSIILIGVNILLLIFAYIIFLKYGRDNKIIEQSRFDPPDGFTPLTLDYYKKSYLSQDGYSASFIYWADKGLINIKQDEKDRVTLIRKVDFNKVKSILQSPLDYSFFKAIFKNSEIDEEINLESLDSEELGYSLNKLKKTAEKTFDSKSFKDQKASKMRILIFLFAFVSASMNLIFSYIASNSFMPLSFIGSFFFILLSTILLSSVNSKWAIYKLFKKISIFFILIVLTLLHFIFSYLNIYLLSIVNDNLNILISFIASISLLILIILFSITEKRSEYAQNILEQLLGYTSFLNLVKVDEIEMMMESNPNFYFKHLSFALILGLTKVWRNKFKKIEVSQPSWYVCPAYGYYSFSRVTKLSSSLNKSLNVPMSEYAKNHSSSSSSTSSGFSGSVGGGAGGGGGGAW